MDFKKAISSIIASRLKAKLFYQHCYEYAAADLATSSAALQGPEKKAKMLTAASLRMCQILGTQLHICGRGERRFKCEKPPEICFHIKY